VVQSSDWSLLMQSNEFALMVFGQEVLHSVVRISQIKNYVNKYQTGGVLYAQMLGKC
jgi:hypothetical protein